ncbi:MAG TPA: calcium-binding protein, partial [Nitrososphaeraceae archaeon]|nr:calcium-binding protein [Nitrososphaeraceae archaeon]
MAIIIIITMIVPSSVLSGWDFNSANGLTESDLLKGIGSDIGTGELSSSTLPLSTSLPILQDLSGNIRDNILGNLSASVLDRLDTFLDSRPIRSFSDTKCVASAITGGTDGITERGVLIIGTNCDDKIKGTEKDEIIYTLGGVDRVFAEQGNDIIYGGLGPDRLYGEQGDDIVIGGAGENLLDGGPGSDVLSAGAGSNLLVGGDNDDELIAGIGTTVMYGGTGANSFDCGLLPGKTI